MLIYVLVAFTTIINAINAKRDINVGTVLFTEADTLKECWSNDEIALLTTRMLMEDILPKRDSLIIQDNAYISDIIDYFRLMLESVRKIAHGKAKHITLLALTDMLGGYLYRYVIPTAKHAYYAGYLNFESMQSLLQLFTELKNFLRTNGHGWAKPISVFDRGMEPQPLPVPAPAPNTDACKGLVYVQNAGEGPGGSCAVIIPLPFFDSKSCPSAIAVPFKTYTLRNIESKASSYILVKYYTAATKCLLSHGNNSSNLSGFNNNLFDWLDTQVLPHLHDDKFYAAFGGVLRLTQTLVKMGAHQQGTKKKMGNYNIMPEMEIGNESIEPMQGQGSTTKRKKSDLILMALLATIFVWFLLGSLFICYRIRASRCRNIKCYDKPDSPCVNKPPSAHKHDDKAPSKSYLPKPSLKAILSKHSSGSQTTKPKTNSSGMMYSSGRVTPTGSIISSEEAVSPHSKRTSTSGSTRSQKSPKSSNPEHSCKASCAYETDKSRHSRCTVCSHKKSQSTRSSGTNNQDITANPCLIEPTSFTGDIRMAASLEDISLRNNQLVFGYDMDTSTSSQSSPRADGIVTDEEDIEDYGVGGDMSK